MKHNEIKYLLPDFVNDKLVDEERKTINEHLASCLDCKREVEELRVLMFELKKESVAVPSSQYWSSLLPRIHERIEHKSERRIPEWLVRYVLPLSAAVVLVVGLFNVKLSTNSSDLTEAQTIAKQLSTEELTQVTEPYTVTGFREAFAGQKDESTSASEDKEVLKEFMQDDNDLSSHTEINVQAAAEKMNAKEADEFIAALQQTFTEN